MCVNSVFRSVSWENSWCYNLVYYTPKNVRGNKGNKPTGLYFGLGRSLGPFIFQLECIRSQALETGYCLGGDFNLKISH